MVVLARVNGPNQTPMHPGTGHLHLVTNDQSLGGHMAAEGENLLLDPTIQRHAGDGSGYVRAQNRPDCAKSSGPNQREEHEMARRPMSQEHKDALAEGRRQGRAIRAYLDALERGRRRGRRVSREELEARVERLQRQIGDERDATKRLDMIQQRLDLEERLVTETDEPDLAVLEADFVAHAAAYSDRKGISWAAWRELGVPAAILTQAGVRRTRRTS